MIVSFDLPIIDKIIVLIVKYRLPLKELRCTFESDYGRLDNAIFSQRANKTKN